MPASVPNISETGHPTQTVTALARAIDGSPSPGDRLDEVNASPEVRSYLSRFGIEADARKTVELAKLSLPAGSTVSFSIEGDGETDEEWLIANLAIHAPEADVFGQFEQFVDSWVKSVSRMECALPIPPGDSQCSLACSCSRRSS